MLPYFASPSLIRGKRVFYVDATGGNDANNGRSPSLAWQTIAKVNGGTFNPGDYILFKRGETWTGTAFLVTWSGKPGAPIVFGAYGSGNRPIVDGNDLVNCIGVSAKSHVQFHNIEVIQGFDFGYYIHGGSDNVALINCVARDCGNDNIIFINNVSHCEIIDCTSYDAYERVGGPRISCLEIADGSHDILVDSFNAYGSEGAGMTLHSHAATEFPYNITVRNSQFNDNDDFGVIIAQSNAGASLPADANINFSNCTMNDNAGPGTGANIYITATGNPYPAGIEFHDCEAITETERPLYVGGRTKFVRCVFEGQWQTYIQNASDVVIWNSTFYRSANIAFTVLGTTDGVDVRNCIFYTGGTSIVDIQTITNVDMDYNLYYCAGAADPVTGTVYVWGGVPKNWADWKADSGMDANSPTPADPLFVDLANDDFHLQAGSPAIDAGVDVGLPYVGSAPDLGYKEYEGS